jgi:ParB/RepB/Spo0J family partition protein
MNLELHQIEPRYEKLRRRSAGRERLLCGSLADIGQQCPVVIVATADVPDRYILVDGYKRFRALRRLRQDTISAVCWQMSEPEALLLERLMRQAEADGPFEQAWILAELRERFGLEHSELARRFDRSASWVSRRLALVKELPSSVQDHVRSGAISAHSAMKYFVPLARAKRTDCERLCSAVAPLRLSTRQVAEVCAAFIGGNEASRSSLLKDPSLFIRASHEAKKPPLELNAARLMLNDLSMVASIARRISRRFRDGVARQIQTTERPEILACARQSQADANALWDRIEKEFFNVG